jgi:tetraacyldisaccharide 4'-kinase
MQPDIILLDDAFQHRKVKSGLSILLMDFSKPFYRDFILPAGNLREFSSGKKRAQLLIVTKCPKDLPSAIKKKIIAKSGFNEEQVYFSTILYGDILSFDNHVVAGFRRVLLVTGIANPSPLYEELRGKNKVELVSFPDHHAFSVSDIQKIHAKFEALEDSSGIILTTEKDFMRLKSIISKTELEKYPWCYIPIKITLDREKEFIQEIKNYVDTI